MIKRLALCQLELASYNQSLDLIPMICQAFLKLKFEAPPLIINNPATSLCKILLETSKFNKSPQGKMVNLVSLYMMSLILMQKFQLKYKECRSDADIVERVHKN